MALSGLVATNTVVYLIHNEGMTMKDAAKFTLLRQWLMLREIPRQPRKIAVGMLTDRLRSAGHETTIRTVQRDLNKLAEVLPLAADGGKPQGWSWIADAAQLAIPAMEPQAALVFHFAEQHGRCHYDQCIVGLIVGIVKIFEISGAGVV